MKSIYFATNNWLASLRYGAISGAQLLAKQTFCSGSAWIRFGDEKPILLVMNSFHSYYCVYHCGNTTEVDAGIN